MGSWGLVDFRGVACREGGTGHAPGGRARNHCAPFLAIFHLYTSENLVHPVLSLYSCSLHPFSTRWDELPMYGSAQTPSNPLAPFAHSTLRGFVTALSLSLSLRLSPLILLRSIFSNLNERRNCASSYLYLSLYIYIKFRYHRLV